MSVLNTKRLIIKPATIQDKRSVFNWLTRSNLTSEMLGLPNFPDAPIPTWEDFNEDYLDHYFNGSKPFKGQCFILSLFDEKIGQINYNEIDIKTNSTEIDIWLADKKYTGRGFGSEAIKWIYNYLKNQFDCKTIFIAPSRRNVNAIKSYKKAGFTETHIIPNNFIPDYNDSVILKKELI